MEKVRQADLEMVGWTARARLRLAMVIFVVSARKIILASPARIYLHFYSAADNDSASA